MATLNFYATVVSGAAVSGNFQLARAHLAGLLFPVVTSCAAYLQGSFDAIAANFLRLQNPLGSGDFTMATGPGSKCFGLVDVPFENLRIEMGVAQADTRTLTLIARY